MPNKPTLRFVKPTLRDITKMIDLVEPEVASGIILARSEDEIATNIRSYTLVFDKEELIGFSALHIHTATLAEIRSLIIAQNYRGQGVGAKLIDHLVQEAQTLGVQKVLSLTYQQQFFEKLGFVEIPKESLPEHKIWADCIKCKHFPICNEVSLIKNL